jgi:hypothetical protein
VLGEEDDEDINTCMGLGIQQPEAGFSKNY